IVAWLWNFGDATPTSSLHPNVSHTYASSGLYTAYLVVTNQCGCKDTFFTKINVLSDPGPDIFCPSVVCENDTTTYHTTGGCGSYTWTVNGGTVLSGSGSTDILVQWDHVDASGYGYVSLSEPCGHCPATTTVKIPVVQSNPVITGPTVLCTNKPYQFSVPLWPGTQYQWGVIGTPSAVIAGRYTDKVSVQFTTAGTYTIHISYQNKLKLCGGDIQFTVTVTDPPIINGPTIACKNASTTQTYTLSTGSSATWTLADPVGGYTTGSGTTFNATFPLKGVYTLTAVVAGICAPDPLVITVSDNPIVVDSISGSALVCHDLPYVYTAGAPISGTHFEWTVTMNPLATTLGYTYTIAPPSGATTNIQFQIPVGTVPVSGAYWTVHVKRVANAAPFCESAEMTLNVYPIIVAPHITGPTTVCANTYTNYSANWPGATNYSWKIINNTTGSVVTGNSANNMSVLWNNYVYATAQIIVTVTQCNDIVNDTLDVSINAAPPMAVTPNPVTVCGEVSTLFTATSGGATYYWDFGDGTTDITTTNTTSHTYTNTGSSNTIATLSVYSTGSTGYCVPSGKATAIVTIKPAPKAIITSTGFNPCGSQFSGTTLYSIITGTGGTVQWYYNGSTITPTTPPNTEVVTLANLGSYYVEVTGPSGCVTTSAVYSVDTVHCDTPCVPAGSVTISPGELCGQITASGTGTSGGINPHWTYPTKLSPTEPVTASGQGTGTLLLFYTEPGLYPITFSEDFGGCTAETTLVIPVPLVPDFAISWGCPGTAYTLNLTDNSAYLPTYGISSYSWVLKTNNSSGTTVATGSSSTFNNTLTSGTYWVKETVIVTPTGSGTPETCSVEKTIIVPVAITAATIQTEVDSIAVTSICEGVPVAMTINTLPSGTSVSDASWNFGDGSGSALYPTARTFTWGVPTNPQPRTITATFHDIVGCPYTATSANINIYQNVVSGNIPGLSAFCSGAPVTLTYLDASSTAVSWLWSTGAATSTISVNTTGSYFVSVKDVYQCPFTTKEHGVSFITITPPQISGFTDYCEGDVVRLSASIGADPS
ncbi:MAG: PKD domain-containing protein, partial [Chitinophagaceae bacterium]